MYVHNVKNIYNKMYKNRTVDWKMINITKEVFKPNVQPPSAPVWRGLKVRLNDCKVYRPVMAKRA